MSTTTVLIAAQTAALTEDATNRAVRTAVQQLAIDVGVAVTLFVVATFATKTGWDDFEWSILGFSLIKTVIATAGAFVMRRYLDGSGVPTPLPPSPVPAPAAPADNPAPALDEVNTPQRATPADLAPHGFSSAPSMAEFAVPSLIGADELDEPDPGVEPVAPTEDPLGDSDVDVPMDLDVEVPDADKKEGA